MTQEPITTVQPRRPVARYPSEGAPTHNGHDAHDLWEQRARVVLAPIAAPSILGLFGFSAATLMVGAYLAGWYGSVTTPLYLFPFALVVGGIAQFLAGMWAYKARDGLATAMHGVWGSFWVGWGILQLLFATGTLPNPGINDPGFGFWFIALAAITLMGTFAAIGENIALTAVLGTLTAGSTCAAIAYMAGVTGWERAAGWLFVFAAGFAWYTAGAMMLEGSFKRVILPLGKYSARQNVPGTRALEPIEFPTGMPGVRVGQ